MRNRLLRPLVFTALTLAAFAAGTSAFAQACESQLVSRGPYLCTILSNFNEEPFTDCFYFATPHPDVSDAFQLYVSGLEDDLVCNCAPSGTSFDATTGFVCTTQEDGYGFGYTFMGKAADGGKKIGKGQVYGEGGDLYVFGCRSDINTCGLALQTPPGKSHWKRPVKE